MNQTMIKSKLHALLAVLAAAGFFGSLSAQTAPAPTTAPKDEAVRMEKFEVNDVPIEQQIVPTSRPFNSVFGLDRSILDTPRNVTIISREQLTAINIQDVRDFSKLTASSYTRSNFGAPTTPDIRTQIADTYSNGMRIGLSSNGNGMPVNFNAVESVNIVKGPATAVYGASQYVGGYADYVTKRPSFDSRKGSVSATVGSFDQYRWTADYNVPVDAKTAYRVSYSGEMSGSYYVDGHKDTQALYAALTHRASDKYEIFVNSEAFYGDYVENFGINRVTQDLIDNGNYITGVNNNPAPNFSGGAFLGYRDSTGAPITFSNINVVAGTPAPISDPQNSRWVTSGFPAVNRIAVGPTVKIDRSNRSLKPGDHSFGFSYNGQAIQTFTPSPDFSIGNNSFLRYVRRSTLSSYSYSEIIDPSWSFENRTEFRVTKGAFSSNSGIGLRYQYVAAFNDFFNEPANVWDLTKDHAFINYFNSVNSPNPFTQVPVPGWPGRYYTPDNGDSGESKVFTTSAFSQNSYKVNDQLTLDAGARVDLLSIKYRDFAGFLPGDSVIVGLPNYNVSASYKVSKDLGTYVTYNYSQNPVGAVGNGGGFTTGGNRNFSNAALRGEAILTEAGAKYSFGGGKGFIGGAIFQQNREQLQQDRSTRKFVTKGFEVELNYQPTKNLYATVGYSYLDSIVNGAEFDVGNTSLTSPLDRYFILPAGKDYRRQGVPRNLFNANTTYKFANGFGLTGGIVATSDILNNVVGTLVIPPQYTLDVTGFYSTKEYEVRLAILNATDQKNWSAPNAVYGNESIVADLPIRAELTLKYKF
jgi:catecholate siderophore receptor